MLGVNVFAADTDAEARAAVHLAAAGVREPAPRPAGPLPPPDAGFAERLTPAERACSTRCCPARWSARPTTVRRGLEAFVARTGADELMVTSQIFDHAARLRSYELASGKPLAVKPGATP